MTWSDFYLICFAVGFLLSAISFVAGGLRLHVHLPHLPHGGIGHLPAGGGASAGGMGWRQVPPRDMTRGGQK